MALLLACQTDYFPKPKGFYRIDFPEKKYQTYTGNCPFEFEYPVESLLDKKSRGLTKPCWLNLHYPQYAATLHLSYFSLADKKLYEYTEESRKLVMQHIVKATQIEELNYTNTQHMVYGVTYNFRGETATEYQFYLTDSVNHFIRGALYFNLSPNPDSLAPVSQFIKADMQHFIETFMWKN